MSEYSDADVEYDEEGRSTGVEREDTGDGIQKPFDPAKIDVTTRNTAVGLLLSRLRRGGLNLNADFQRRPGIWNEEKQSRLIESLLLRIPLPTLYAAEIGEDESWTVIDGIQRMTTIARFVSPKAINKKPLKLVGLEYLQDFNGFSYDGLPAGLRTRIDETELVVHLIRKGTPEAVMFNIFARINTGGLPLTPQELRHALIGAPARDLLKDLAEGKAFKEATQGTIRSDRMADREMILRFFSFRIYGPEDYSGDLDTFLRDGMKQINALDDDSRNNLIAEFERSMRNARDIFGEHAFRKVSHGQTRRLPISKTLFEATSVNLARMKTEELELLKERKEQVMENFKDLMADAESRFQQSISFATGNEMMVKERFKGMERLLRQSIALLSARAGCSQESSAWRRLSSRKMRRTSGESSNMISAPGMMACRSMAWQTSANGCPWTSHTDLFIHGTSLRALAEAQSRR